MVPKTPNPDEHLIPAKRAKGDLFICDAADAVLKDLIPQMEHPFYSLSKKPETSIRRYEHNGNWLQIVPSVKGLATIYDKDILIYCLYSPTGERRGRTITPCAKRSTGSPGHASRRISAPATRNKPIALA